MCCPGVSLERRLPTTHKAYLPVHVDGPGICFGVRLVVNALFEEAAHGPTVRVWPVIGRVRLRVVPNSSAVQKHNFARHKVDNSIVMRKYELCIPEVQKNRGVGIVFVIVTHVTVPLKWRTDVV